VSHADDAARHYKTNQARSRAMSIKADVPLRKYLSAMELAGEIVPGAADVIAAKVLDPTRATRAGVDQTSASAARLANSILGGGGGAPPAVGMRGGPRLDSPSVAGGAGGNLVRAAEFLAGEGAVYLTAPDGNPAEPPLKAVLRRFGLPGGRVDQVYRDHAAALAGRTGGALIASVFGVLAEIDGGIFLGAEPGRSTALEMAARPAAPPEPRPTVGPDPKAVFLGRIGF